MVMITRHCLNNRYLMRFYLRVIIYCWTILFMINRFVSLVSHLHTSSKGHYHKLLESKAVSHPFKDGLELTLRIEDITNQGIGVGRTLLVDGSKWVVMVPLVLPGEEVMVRVKRSTATYSEAEVVEVLESSPDRTEPLCKYFSICGGCQYQHANISVQRYWKKKQVHTALQRIGGFATIELNEVIGTEDVFHYRSKITPHAHFSTPANFKMGFQERATNRIIDIETCVIASHKINQEYSKARMKLKGTAGPTSKRSNSKDITLLFREYDGGRIETDRTKHVTQTVNNIKFSFLAGDFFQNNPYVVPLMQKHVVEQSLGHNCSFLIDAYCGSGLFSLGAASHFQQVYGIELNDKAIAAARQNAASNNIRNVVYFSGSAENIFAEIEALNVPASSSVLVIDPPRKGCDTSFLRQLIRFNPRKIVYISCDPATQARDAKQIAAAGYDLINVTPFDMFPQTRHIENIVTFLSRS